jgi:dipeptidase E
MIILTSILNLVLDQIISDEVLNIRDKKILIITTATGYKPTTPDYVLNDIKALTTQGAKINTIDVSKQTYEKNIQDIKNCEIICITGGNTFYLLQELIKTKTNQLIVKAIKQGKSYIGSSAGSVILAQDIKYVTGIDKPEVAHELKTTKSLGIINTYPCVHFDSEDYSTILHKLKGKRILPIKDSEYKVLNI